MRLADLRAEPQRAIDYQALQFDYERSPDQDAARAVRHGVVVVGAGPVGLSLAIDLAQRGVPVVVLDGDCRLSTGSRAICFAQRTLDIFDRLGCGDRMVAKGVSWSVGKVFFRDEPVYRFDLQPEPGHGRPAFINLQQYYVEGYLAERAAALPLVDLRWRHKVVGVEPQAEGVMLTVETPQGPYRLEAGYLAACDGSRSTVRQLIGQESHGRVFKDRFLIADVRMQRDQPPERWFWFDPPFHRGQSVLLHMQPDGVWRIDFQLGWDADPEQEKRPEKIIPRVKALLGEGAQFELEWASVYTFACLRMDRFRHGRILFAGDAAHGVSPFGARGANSGVQDAENLAWKLAAVLEGRAPDALLDSYADERECAADENILNSTRSTDFITPKSEVSRLFRDAVLHLAKHHPFARSLVNSGRLSRPTTLAASPLNTPDAEGDAFGGRMVPGAPAVDAPVRRADGREAWLLRELGADFTALVGAQDGSAALPRELAGAVQGLAPLKVVVVAPPAADTAAGTRAASAPPHDAPGDPATVTLVDTQGLVAQRYGLRPGSLVLLRPDQHVCARLHRPTPAALRRAVERALARA